MKWCGESRIMDYRADIVCFVVSWGACEGFSSGACHSDCQIFLMWHVQAIQSLSLLKDRHPCFVLKSVYLVIRGSGRSHLGVKLFPKDYFQHCFSSALSPPHYICFIEDLFHLIMGLMHYLHGCCLLLYSKDWKTLCCDWQRIQPAAPNWNTNWSLCRALGQADFGVTSSSVSCCSWLSLLIWSSKNYSEIILPLQFVLEKLLVLAVDSKPCADQ